MNFKKLLIPCLMASVLIPSFDGFAAKTRSQGSAASGIELVEAGDHSTPPRPARLCCSGETISSSGTGGWSTWSKKKKVAVVVSVLGLGVGALVVAAVVIPRMTGLSEDGDADLGVTPISNATFPALTTSPLTTASQRDCFDRDGFLKDDLKPDYFRDYAQRNNLSTMGDCEKEFEDRDFERSMFFSENLYKMGVISKNQGNSCKTYSSGNNTCAFIVTFSKGDKRSYSPGYQKTFSSVLRKLNITGTSDNVGDPILLLEKHFLKQYAQSQGLCLAPADATAAPRGKRDIPEAPISQKSQIGGYDVSWKGAWEGFSDEWKKSFNGTYATLKKGISTPQNKIDRLRSHLAKSFKRRFVVQR